MKKYVVKYTSKNQHNIILAGQNGWAMFVGDDKSVYEFFRDHGYSRLGNLIKSKSYNDPSSQKDFTREVIMMEV